MPTQNGNGRKSRFGVDVTAIVRGSAQTEPVREQPTNPEVADPSPPPISQAMPQPAVARPVARQAGTAGSTADRRQANSTTDRDPRRRPENWQPPAGRIAAPQETARAIREAHRDRNLAALVPRRAPGVGGVSDEERARDRELLALYMRGPDENLPVPVPTRGDGRNIAARAGRGPGDVTQNLPAVAARDVAREIGYQPAWHLCKNLPGLNSDEQLRIIIRRTFSAVTHEDAERISMICDLLNDPAEVRAVATWVARNAQRCDDVTFEYDRSFPGFQAEFLVYKDEKTTYLVTRDVGGHYVYVAPGGLGPAATIESRPTSQRRRVGVTPGVV